MQSTELAKDVSVPHVLVTIARFVPTRRVSFEVHFLLVPYTTFVKSRGFRTRTQLRRYSYSTHAPRVRVPFH
jgi:hypothetical protein